MSNEDTAYIDKSPFGTVKACGPIVLIGLSESNLVVMEQNQIRVVETLGQISQFPYMCTLLFLLFCWGYRQICRIL